MQLIPTCAFIHVMIAVPPVFTDNAFVEAICEGRRCGAHSVRFVLHVSGSGNTVVQAVCFPLWLVVRFVYQWCILPSAFRYVVAQSKSVHATIAVMVVSMPSSSRPYFPVLKCISHMVCAVVWPCWVLTLVACRVSMPHSR
jgi:hypothetical protein